MSDESRYGLPPAHGLYRPAFEHDVRRRLRRAHQGQAQPPDSDRRRGSAPQHGPPRRVRLRAEHGRRRRHSHGAAARVSREGREGASSAPSCRPPGKFAAGIVFLPTDAAERERCKEVVERIIAEQGQTLVGWRQVPTRPKEADIGPTARARRAAHRAALDRRRRRALAATRSSGKLYLIRKQASHELRGDTSLRRRRCSTSARSRRR